MNVCIIHGPNLNLLGVRDTAIYGADTLEQINAKIDARAGELGLTTRCFQSNVEGEIVGFVQEARDWASAIIMNAGAYTHYSYAIRDALADARLPTVEVHLSNVHAREEWRHVSVLAPVARGVIAGFGVHSYLLALAAVHAILSESPR